MRSKEALKAHLITVSYRKNHPDNFRVSAYQPPTTYDDRSKEHRNVVFADTLEVIENIVLFSIQ